MDDDKLSSAAARRSSTESVSNLLRFAEGSPFRSLSRNEEGPGSGSPPPSSVLSSRLTAFVNGLKLLRADAGLSLPNGRTDTAREPVLDGVCDLDLVVDRLASCDRKALMEIVVGGGRGSSGNVTSAIATGPRSVQYAVRQIGVSMQCHLRSAL